VRKRTRGATTLIAKQVFGLRSSAFVAKTKDPRPKTKISLERPSYDRNRGVEQWVRKG
jgi:hypothetical protein